MTLGVAIVGCGLIGKKRADALPDGARVVSTYDVAPSRSASLAAQHDGAVAASSAQEAFERADIAIVATLHQDLASLAVRALQSDCHVLIEKPGARRPVELDPVREAAATKDRIVRVGFNHRFHPSFLKVREMWDQERHGNLMNIRARYGHGGRLGYETEWRADRELSGGGELLDQGIHLIDLVRYLAGDARLAFAELRTDFWEMPVEDNAFLALHLEPRGFAWLHASWTEWKNLFSFEIAYERAKFEVNGLGGSYGTERCTLYEMSEAMGPPMTFAWEWPHADGSWNRELADMIGAIDDQPSVGATLEDAVAALAIVDDAYRR